MKKPAKETNIAMADGMFAKHYRVARAKTVLPQHSHTWDHITLISYGAVAVTCDGVDKGILWAPASIVIKAGTKHTFRTVLPGTVISCIHRIDRTGEIEVAEEHQLPRVA